MNHEKPSESPSPELPAWNPIEALVLPAARSYALVGLATCLGLFGGVFFALLKPNEYESEAKIFVQPWQRSSFVFDDLPGDESGPAKANPDIANQFHLLTSEEVFLNVAKHVGPHTILRPYDPAANDGPTTPFLSRKLHEFQSWWFRASAFESAEARSPDYVPSTGALRAAVEVLKNNTTCSTDGRSNIIDIAYKAHSPELSEQILRSILEQHEKRHLEVHSLEGRMQLWDEQRKKYAEESDLATTKFNEFKREHQVSNLSDQIADLFSEQERLERELEFEDRVLLTSRKTKLAELERKLATTSEKVVVEASKRPGPNPEYTRKSFVLGELRKELLALENEFVESAPEITEKKMKIAEVEKQLGALEPTIDVPVPEHEAANPDYAKTLERIELLEEGIDEMALQVETKTNRLTKVRERVNQLRGLQTTFDELKRSVETANQLKSGYESALLRFSLSHDLESQSQSNLKVWTQPTIPFQKSGPQRTKLVLAGFAGGLLAGFGLALIRSVLDQSVRRRRQLEILLGVPCVAVVPATHKWSWRQARKAAGRVPIERLP